MKIYGKGIQTVRGFLIGVSCDMPAGRMVCGFLGHSATLGCNKCFKKFPGSVGSKDYSGFDRENPRKWKKRTNEIHRSNIHEIQQAKTKTERDKLESEYGCRYSVLLQLPYFDPTQMSIIDPMHNLFLGTAKHLTKLWINSEPAIITNHDLTIIQEFVDEMHAPADVGRIPRKIDTGSGFSGFTADQFKSWVMYYSIPSLFKILNSEHLECWRHYVLACRLLCQRSISLSQISLADALIVQFCKRFEFIYGKNHVTPNMHGHCHLREVFLDYGPVYGFSFERMNGVLEHQPTNHHCIEVQLMTRFNHDSGAYAIQNPSDFYNELNQFCILRQNLTGSLLTTENCGNQPEEFSNVFTLDVFESYEAQNLKQLLAKLHAKNLDEININLTYKKYKYVKINSIKILSSTPKHKSIALVSWNSHILGELTSVQDTNPIDTYQRPILINCFIKASFFIDGDIKTQNLASVQWLQTHPSRFIIGKPAQIWCKNLFERGGMHSFVPLGYLICRCAYASMRIDGENVLCIVPLVT